MIYLRPSRRIKSAEPSDRIVISDSLLDEYLGRLISLNADKRPFNLHLEASNGVALSEQGVTATELSARILTREGVDVTTLVKTLSLAWQIEGKEVGQGLSYTAQAASLKSWHTKVTATTTVTRILEAMGKLDKHAPGVQRILEEYTIEASIELRRDSILLQRIPTTDLLIGSLKQDRQFLASVKGDKGDSVTLADLNIRWDDDKLLIGGAKSESLKGQDAPPTRPNLLRGFMGVEKPTASAVGSANVHTRLGIKPFLEPGKRYVLSADFELIEGSANAVSIGLLTTSGTFLVEAKNPLNGTKTRVSLQISLDASTNPEEIVDVLGYAGERGKTRGNLARYYNIKLEEVTSDSDKASAYLPHPEDLRGIDGNSVTLEDLKIRWEGDQLTIAGAKSQSLRGSSGKDAVPLRPNLFDFACLFESAQKVGLSFDDVAAGKKLNALPLYIRQRPDTVRLCTGVALQFDILVKRTQKESGKFTRRPTLRIMRGDAVLLVSNGAYISEQAGTYHYEVVRSISKAIAQHEQGFYVHAWVTDYGSGLLDCEVSNIKIEYLYEGEPQQCSIYTPKPSDMIPLSPRIIDGRWYIADRLTHKYIDSGIKALGVDGKSPTPQEVADAINTTEWQALLADQTARKVTDSDTHLAKIREGMATRKELEGYGQELNTVIDRQSEILGMHETLAQWVDVHKMAINSINRDMEQATTNIYNHTIKLKKHNDTLITLVEQDIIKFSYHAATSQEWADYTDREYVGGGHHPDPWGGVGDGYMRAVHNYEIWRSLDRIPSVYIEQSRKTLRTDEYQINGQPHRDLSALIVYSLQDVAPIERDTARHWQLFTSPFVPTVLRYGNKTVMGTESVSGNKVGDYYNLPLDKSCTYDIYCNNDGSGKYKIYIIKNGEYK